MIIRVGAALAGGVAAKLSGRHVLAKSRIIECASRLVHRHHAAPNTHINVPAGLDAYAHSDCDYWPG